MAKEAVLETVLMAYGDDGILRVTINEGANIGIAQAKLQKETTERLCGNLKVPVLVDARASYTITKEAEEYGAQQSLNRIATAVISSSPFAKITLNVFISIFKPATAFKVFSNEEDAVLWLKEQMR